MTLRILILGSIHWLLDPDPDPVFSSMVFKMPLKRSFFRSFFSYDLRYIHISFLRQQVINKSQNIRSFFLIFLLVAGRMDLEPDPNPYLRINYGSGSGSPKNLNDGLFQRQYYASLLPSVFVGLQDMDERRIKCIQNFMRKSAQTEQEVSHKRVKNCETGDGR